MIGKIIGLIVVAVGALICYGAKLLSKNVLKNPEPDDKTLAQIKLVGLGIAIIGIVLLFVIGGVSI